MRKGLLLLAALLLAGAPSAVWAAKAKKAAAKPAPSFMGDMMHQLVVPFESAGKAMRPAAPAKAKKAKRSKGKAKAKRTKSKAKAKKKS